MKNRLKRATDVRGVKAPYDHLYIYHIEGRVPPSYCHASPGFIGLWQEADSAFLFFTQAVPSVIAELVHTTSGLIYQDCYHLTYDQWHGGRFNAFRVGDLEIIPAWQIENRSSDHKTTSKTILLDPGVVFGVGTHPTTRDCLAALQLAYETSAPTTAVDLGTGTGLLALAAVRQGSSRVLAVDMNALAARTALANVRLNQMEDYVMVTQGDALDLVSCPADLVIANIHYDVMRRLIDTKAFQEKTDFVLSGLMRREAKDITGELNRRSISIVKAWQHDGIWFTFYARRQM